MRARKVKEQKPGQNEKPAQFPQLDFLERRIADEQEERIEKPVEKPVEKKAESRTLGEWAEYALKKISEHMDSAIALSGAGIMAAGVGAFGIGIGAEALGWEATQVAGVFGLGGNAFTLGGLLFMAGAGSWAFGRIGEWWEKRKQGGKESS